MKVYTLHLSTAILLPIAMMACQAHAQAQVEAAAAAEDAGVADIVVTAQKRAENLQRVPIVITAINGEEMESAGITNLQTLPAVTPGLTSRVTAGAFQPYIRGVGTSSNVVENPVALYIDGVYLPQQREGLRELPDVQQVAVLKGPQGTLFGRNATGGVIQITTKTPTQDSEFMARAGIDNYATFRGTVYAAGGIADGIAASFSADYTDQGEGYGTNLTNGHDTLQLLYSLSLRGKLVFELGSRTDVTVIGDYMNRKERAYNFVPYPGTAYTVPFAPVGNVRDTRSQIDPFTAFKGGGVSLTIDHDLDFAKLVSISAYRRGSTSYLFDDVPTGTPAFYVQVDKGDQPNKSFSQEIQLISNDSGPFTWTVGAFYFWNKIANTPITRTFYEPFYPPAVFGPTSNRLSQTFGIETTESIAPFGQATWEFAPGTRLTVGGRWTYEKRDFEGSTVLTRYNGTVLTVPKPAATPDSLTVKKPTWRIALDQQFTPDILGYVSYNRGIKSGGFNVLNVNNPPYQPERLDAYEAGLKTQIFDRRLRLNIGGFYYDYSNLQVIQFLNNAQTVVNGAKARIYGLDVDFNAKLSNALSLSGGMEIMHAEFTDYRNAVGSIVRPGGGGTLVTVDASGNRIPQAQKFAASLAADYETDVSFGNLHFNVTGNYNGDYYFEPDNFLRQGSFVMLNSSITWTSSDEHYSLSFWGRNLANEKIITNASSQAIGYPISYGQAPRTYGVTAKLSF
ncbi:TonB-dependent receptor [Sphingobium phenoxybenzoativorans]|uniref:TonB-dependent receptor n=1 Tax=Sphingobium phenoxybenzoativorans TaxID=1592790 RepID=A0A975K7X2_9SPHN|nr:TonB-dependent receptor [Sphingobium phenoxybenzoativorans]QUT05718.1 TonB-dependent receptor [Sphingobium phenoxybenzoativorans]